MSDYKQRMIREHRELQERISKLAHMLEATRRARWTSRPRAPSSSLKANCTRWDIREHLTGACAYRTGGFERAS